MEMGYTFSEKLNGIYISGQWNWKPHSTLLDTYLKYYSSFPRKIYETYHIPHAVLRRNHFIKHQIVIP